MSGVSFGASWVTTDRPVSGMSPGAPSTPSAAMSPAPRTQVNQRNFEIILREGTPFPKHIHRF